MRSLLQMTLDLFGPEPVVATPPKPAAPPPAPVFEGPVAAPAEPLDQVLAPAIFHHPRANRRARLGDSFVAYEFKRARRRTIGFSVGPEGLVVSAPRWVGLGDVEAALRERAGWIVKKLGEARERQAQLAAARIEWRDGATLPFLGEPVVLVLDPRQDFGSAGGALRARGVTAVLDAAGTWQADGASPGEPAPRALHIGLPHSAEPAQIRDATQAWLMRQARRVFTERLEHFAPQLGVQWRKLALSSAGTRWGSASADGSIRLNWRLIHFKLSVIDYVVAHELSHLRVMDHSPRFWETVATVMPDYAERRRALKDEAVPTW